MSQDGWLSFEKKANTVCEKKPDQLKKVESFKKFNRFKVNKEPHKQRRQKRDLFTKITDKLGASIMTVLYFIDMFGNTNSSTEEKQVPSPRPSTSMTPWVACRKKTEK